jgi:Family of unknown function (DUF6502)
LYACDNFPRTTEVYAGIYPSSIICVKYSRKIVLKCNLPVIDPNMTPIETRHASPSPILVTALRKVLRPLVRLMVSHGITLPYLVEMLKSLLVEVVDKDFRIGDKPTTDSRVSLLSGVHRKDVNRLRKEESQTKEKAPASVSLGAQLVAQWLGNGLFTDDAGKPRQLPRYVSEGGPISFEALVLGVNSDIRSRVVLDEWLRLGVVHLTEDRLVCLNTQAFIPTKGFDEKAFYFGHNLHDHAAAATHNLLGNAPPFLDRSVHYMKLDKATVDSLAAQAEVLGMQALLAVNKMAMSSHARISTSYNEADQYRMTFGIYFYSEPCKDSQTHAGQTQEPVDDKPLP